MCLHPNSPLHSDVYRAWRACFLRLPSPSCTPGLGDPLAALEGGSDDLGIWCRPRQLGVRNRRPGEARHQFSLHCPAASTCLFVLHRCQILISLIEPPPQAQSCPDSDTQPPPLDQGQTKKGSSKLKLGLGQNSDGQLPNSNHRDPAPLSGQPVCTFFTLDRPNVIFPNISIFPANFLLSSSSSDSISESHLSRPYLEQQSRQILGSISFGLQHQS